MSRKKVFIIQKDDIKSKEWKDAAKKLGITILPQAGSPVRAPALLLKAMLRFSKPSGYIVRYLNDYPSLSKTLLRVVSELSLVVLCVVFRVRIFWICHNVDQETASNYPSLSAFRRWMFSSLAEKMFVTDRLLVHHAKCQFPNHSHKIEEISFGECRSSGVVDDYKEMRAISFIERKVKEARSEGGKAIVLFCAGAPDNGKYLHFDYMEQLLEEGKTEGYRIIAIVAGDFRQSLRGRVLSKKFSKNRDICIFDSFTQFSSQFIDRYVDFYWRGYDDWSVPFSVYEAATFGKPTLALNSGFLPEMVTSYGIGKVVAPSFDDLGIALDGLLSEESKTTYEDFLLDHQWCSLPKILSKAV